MEADEGLWRTQAAGSGEHAEQAAQDEAAGGGLEQGLELVHVELADDRSLRTCRRAARAGRRRWVH